VLEDLVREAWARCPNNLSRVVVRADGTSVMGMEGRDYGANGFAIHCASYVEQQGVGVVRMAELPVSQLTVRQPGNDENFANKDFFAVISGDHVISLNANRNAAALRSYLHQLFEALGFDDDAKNFTIDRVAHADEIARIDQVGVANVEMDFGIEEATAIAIAEQQVGHGFVEIVKRGVTAILRPLVAREDQVAGIGDSRKGSVRIAVNVPAGDLELAKSGLDGIAAELVADEDADGYVIRLRTGEMIRPGEIAVRKRVSLTRFADTVDAEEVLAEMVSFMIELRNTGQLGA
jgi:hypothetical protein